MALTNGIMKFDARVFKLLSDDLYQDDLSFIRELVANSVDAGADEIQIAVGNDTIEIEDNGKGMTKDFLMNDFTRIGKDFKQGDTSKIGIYGVGRLSVWKIAKSVKVLSGNYCFSWDAMNWSIEDLNEYVEGTKYVIEHDEVIDSSNITEWIEQNFFSVKAKVYVNGEHVVTDKLTKMTKYFLDSQTSVYYHYPNEDQVDQNDNCEIQVLERGYLVKTDTYGLPVIVDFDKQIKTLSRENCKVDMYDLKRDVIKFAPNFLSTLTIEQLTEIKDLILELVNSFRDASKCSDYLVYNGQTIAAIQKNARVRGQRVVSAKGNSIYKERAEAKGWIILTVDSTQEESILRSRGIEEVNNIKELSRVAIHVGAKTMDEKRTLRGSAKFLNRLDILIKSKLETFQSRLINKTGYTPYAVERTFRTFGNTDKVENVNGYSNFQTVGGFKICFGSKEDADTIAWIINNTIALNKENKMIQLVVETGKVEYLEEVLIHEYTHSLVKNDGCHDNEFNMMYNLISQELAVEELSLIAEKQRRKAKSAEDKA